MKPSEYNLDRDIPDQAGKVFFVTGGKFQERISRLSRGSAPQRRLKLMLNPFLILVACLTSSGTGGIGRETVLNLIKHNPAHIIFTGRNVDSAEDVIATASIADQSAAARLHFIACDMTSLTSVRDCAATFIEGPHGARLDVLLANAGVLGPPLAPNELTKEGFEPRMGINHLAHALLIQLLLPVMRKTAKSVKNIDIGNEDDKVDASTNAAARKPRIIVLTSSAHGGPPIFYNSLRSLPSYTSLGSLWVYCQSKLANMLYAEELARREPDLTVVAIHPGVVRTKMVESTPFLLHWILKFRGYYEGR